MTTNNITDKQVDAILSLTEFLGFPRGTKESLVKQIRDIIGEPTRSLDWKQGPPPQGGPDEDIVCVVDRGTMWGFRRRNNVLSWTSGALANITSFNRITQHASIGTIPEPPKPLPDKPTRFLCVHNETKMFGIGRYIPGKRFGLLILWNDNEDRSIYSTEGYEKYFEITELLDN